MSDSHLLVAPDFQKAAANYDIRIDYKPEQIDEILSRLSIPPNPTIADIGSGTGKLSKALEGKYGALHCIEPDDKMRAQCRQTLAGFPNTLIHEGTSDRTGLADHSVDLVVAGDAAHWFQNPRQTTEEFKRILKPGGKIAMLVRYPDPASPMVIAFDKLLEKHCLDYRKTGANRLAGSQQLIERKKGMHLVADDAQEITEKMPTLWTPDQFVQWLRSRSTTNEWANAHPDDAMNKVVRPLFEQFAGELHEGKLTMPYIYNVRMGDVKTYERALSPPRPRTP